MTTAGQVTDTGLRAEDAQLRTDLEKVKGDQAQVDQRKTELIQTVKGKIAALQQLLVEYGETTGVPALAVPATTRAAAPVKVPPRPGVGTRRDETPIIEYVRRELTSVGREISAPDLKQALITKHKVPPTRLKNLSQLLYKSTSVYKEGGKIGLVEWKQRKQAAKPASRRAPKGASAAAE